MHTDEFNSTDLFIVASPFQLLCAVEAANYLKDDSKKILILINGELPNAVKSIDMLLIMYRWDKIIRLKLSGTFNFLVHVYYMFLFKKGGFRNVYVGDIRGWYFQLPFALNVKRSGKLFLLDDGAVTIYQQAKFLSENEICHYEEAVGKDMIKKIIYVLLGFRVRINETINLFTIFDLTPFGNQIVIKNELSILKKEIRQQVIKTETIFIGSNLVGHNIISENHYLQFIENTQKYFNKELVYFPHRTESEFMLNKIAKIPGVTLHRSEYFIEFELIHKGICPENIISFWSTSLYSLNMLFPQSQYYYIRIEDDNLRKDMREEVQIVTEFYKSKLPLSDLKFD